MKTVSVKELKARLSKYLRLAKCGEIIPVTERNDVVAEIGPPPTRLRASGEMEERLNALSDAGEVTRSALPKRGWTWKCRGLGLAPGTAHRILDDVRGDRSG